MMNPKHLKSVRIENFKSIKDIDIDCKRVNIFIGKPNVGKSNLLEALSMLSDINVIKDTVRFKKPFQLFYDNDINLTIKILTNQIGVIIKKTFGANQFDFIVSNDSEILDNNFDGDGVSAIVHLENQINEDKQEYNGESNSYPLFSRYNTSDFHIFNVKSHSPILSNIHKYIFKLLDKYNEGGPSFLTAPYGSNIWQIIQSNKALSKKISELFKEYNLEFLIDFSDEKFEIQKRIDNLVYKFDYGLIADTLQRVIFHYAAIESNKDSVLLFEEPEAHSYPGFIRDLAIEIKLSETNQFFITTHSPYLLNNLITNLSFDECAVFICSYQDHQTKMRELSNDEVEEAIDFGQDLFININAFIDK